MSAYIVEDLTINRILAGLRAKAIGRSLCKPQGLLAPKTREEAAALGAVMLMINAASVDARYGDGRAEDFRSLDYQYEEMAPPADIQLLKSIRCWLYQSCESESCCADPVFQAFEAYSNHLSYEIVSGLSSFEAADWG